MSEQKLSALGKAMAKQMARSWEAPQFQLYASVSCESMIAYRATLGFKPSCTTILAKAVSDTLRDFPLLNAAWSDGTKLELNESVNLGIAVDTARGLLVPVIRDAQTLDLSGLHDAVQSIKAKGGVFRLEDLTGGAFVPEKTMNLGLCMDHRVVDGATGAKFLTALTERLEHLQ